MNVFETYGLAHNNVLSVYSDRDRVDMSPAYQRQGEIWSIEKQQLLIDSIINRFDIPKLYFHKLEKAESRKRKKDYAVVDGRQRLEAVFGFLDGHFALAKDFEFLADKSVGAAGMTYADLAKQYPKLKQRLDSFALPIICIETDDLDLIDDLFFRLNEAVPLNAAEKRNAIGGDMAAAIKEIAASPFFQKKIRFSNKRYQHLEVAARLLFIEFNLRHEKILDTKKPLLDQFVRDHKSGKKAAVAKLKDRVLSVLSVMASQFVGKDVLLASQGAVPIYYLIFREAMSSGKLTKLSRRRFAAFNAERQKNRDLAANDLGKADYELLEFDRMSQQGTNDASSIRERSRILREYLGLQRP